MYKHIQKDPNSHYFGEDSTAYTKWRKYSLVQMKTRDFTGFQCAVTSISDLRGLLIPSYFCMVNPHSYQSLQMKYSKFPGISSLQAATNS